MLIELGRGKLAGDGLVLRDREELDFGVEKLPQRRMHGHPPEARRMRGRHEQRQRNRE